MSSKTLLLALRTPRSAYSVVTNVAVFRRQGLFRHDDRFFQDKGGLPRNGTAREGQAKKNAENARHSELSFEE